jgi:superfamily II DNA or RNA helicase
VLGQYCNPETIIKESASKTIFFASSVKPVVELGAYLTSKGFQPALVYAKTNASLTQIIDGFTDNPSVNPLCATMASLSEAVPVTAASVIVLLNRPFRQATWDQIVARADRLGQQHQVYVYEVTLDTGDEPNVSSTTDAILSVIREDINAMIGPEFSGPDPTEREILAHVDARGESPEQAFDLDKFEVV